MVDWRIHRYGRVTTTMDIAAELAAAGAPAGTVVLAEEQTAGRGREGRRWLAPPGTSLLFTLVARPPFAAVQDERLSVRVAEHVAHAIARTCGLEPAIKEPNDLLVGGRKLVGILLQSRVRGEVLDYLLIGIGINVNIPADRLPLPTATSLLVELGRPVDREALLAAVLDELGRDAQLFPDQRERR
ncbi:MAG: biotin--[acetyl-CoA-carboxylase] ligase [Thermomicrobium sp.]|nr:biotin--[acetyl-CoA-carboxylase] ligase [Thermomicrobium sp.]